MAEYLTKTHGSTHSIEIGLKNVFRVERDGEDGNEEVMEQIGNRLGTMKIEQVKWEVVQEASVARISSLQLLRHSLTGTSHCPSRGTIHRIHVRKGRGEV